MKIERVYPLRIKRTFQRKQLIQWMKWPFLATAAICAIINVAVGGLAWSIIVLWSLWMFWSNLISPSLIELNRISMLIKLTAHVCILLALINLLLAPGFAVVVVPIVCGSGLLLTGLLFFINIGSQKLNVMPLLMLDGVSLIGAIVGTIYYSNGKFVALMVMGILAASIMIACIFVLRESFVHSLKKYFSTN